MNEYIINGGKNKTRRPYHDIIIMKFKTRNSQYQMIFSEKRKEIKTTIQNDKEVQFSLLID